MGKGVTMRAMIVVTQTVCVVIDDDRDPPRHAVACCNPLDDLIQRMRREMQHGRESVKWRKSDGTQVA